MRGEARLKHLVAHAHQVHILVQGSAIVLRHEHPDILSRLLEIGIKHLAEPERNPVARASISDVDPRHSHDVLSQVVDINAGPYLSDTPCSQRPIYSGAIADLADQRKLVEGHGCRRGAKSFFFAGE